MPIRVQLDRLLLDRDRLGDPGEDDGEVVPEDRADDEREQQLLVTLREPHGGAQALRGLVERPRQGVDLGAGPREHVCLVFFAFAELGGGIFEFLVLDELPDQLPARVLALVGAALVQWRQHQLLNQTVQFQNDYLQVSLHQLQSEYLRLRTTWRDAAAQNLIEQVDVDVAEFGAEVDGHDRWSRYAACPAAGDRSRAPGWP